MFIIMKLEIDLKNVHIDEIKELKDYLENNCWKWKEIKKENEIIQIKKIIKLR